MQILHVISSCAPGGAEVFVRDLALTEQRDGNQVAVAYISSARDQGSSTSFEASFQAELTAAGVRLFELGHSVRTSPLRGGMALRKCLKAFRADVVHFHLARALLFRLFAPGPGRTVYTHHNTVLNFHRFLFRLFDRVVDRYVAICEPSERLLKAHVRKPIVRIYNGIDTTRIEPTRSPKTTSTTVLSVGSLTPQKNYDALIEVAERLLEPTSQVGPVVFLIAGEGPERARLETVLQARGLSKAVQLLGARTDVNELMQRADVLLMTSIFEGFPISLIEATASGLPIVCTDVGGCAEIVIHGETGFVVKPGSIDALVAALTRLLSDAELLSRFSENARRSFRFSIRDAAHAHDQMYRQVIRGFRTPSSKFV